MNEGIPEDRNKLIEKKEQILKTAQKLLEAKSYRGVPELFTYLAKISQSLDEHYEAEEFINIAHQIRLKLAIPSETTETLPTQDVLSRTVATLISHKRKKRGTPLKSGIIPVIVKDEKEVLFESLTEVLPYLPNSEKQLIINKLLKQPFGSKRDQLLNTFIQEYKSYGIEELDRALIKEKLHEVIEWFNLSSARKLRDKMGIFDPLQITESLTFDELSAFIGLSSKSHFFRMKDDILLKFYYKIQSDFKNFPEYQDGFGNPLNYLGYFLYSDPSLRTHFEKYDFISKYELMEVFANFCADNEFTVFDLTKDSHFLGDLYLIQKTPRKVGIACVLRGYEIQARFEETIEKLKNSMEYSDWLFFITTPYGVLNLGLNKLRRSLNEIGAWCYIVDPVRSLIYGLLKGSDSSNKLKEKEEEVIKQLRSPLRSPASQQNLSKFYFDKKFQYKSQNFVLFGKNEYPIRRLQFEFIEKDILNLQYLLLFYKKSGMRLDFFEWTDEPMDPILLSGLISALNGFGASLRESYGLQQIDYKGFSVTFAEGAYIKACLFLKESPSLRLKELLKFSVKKWEDIFENELKNFNGDLTIFANNHSDSEKLFDQIFLSKT